MYTNENCKHRLANMVATGPAARLQLKWKAIMPNLESIDLLRYAVKLFNSCREDFNQKYSAADLLKIAAAHRAGKWDIFPDDWTARQCQDAINYGASPDWDDSSGRLVAKVFTAK